MNIGDKHFNSIILEQTISCKEGKLWKLKCICGNDYYATTKELNRKNKKTCGHEKQYDFIGQRFGSGVVIEKLGSKIYEPKRVLKQNKENKKGTVYTKVMYWKLKCDCGNIYEGRTSQLLSKKLISCGCKKKAKKVAGDILYRYWIKIQKEAVIRQIEFKITPEFAWNLFIKQNKQCALSGEKLNFGRCSKEHDAGLTTASLDRIDSNGNYTEDNVQWVHKSVNFMKQSLSNSDFKEWCKKIHEFSQNIS